MATAQNLAKWLMFTVLVSLSPFAVLAGKLWVSDTPIYLRALWPHGELLLVSTALAADAMGDVIANGFAAQVSQVQGVFRTITAGACLITILTTVWWYSLAQNSSSLSLEKMSKGSIYLFIFTILTCMTAKIMAEE